MRLMICLSLSLLMTTGFANQVSSPKNSSYSTLQASILKGVNDYRRSRFLSSLSLNELISEEARKHSQAMASHKRSFGHQGFSARIKYLYHRLGSCRAGAENVAFNYKDSDILVKGWIKSPGHRRNIVGSYNLTGIGMAEDRQGKRYYTQIFLRCS